MISGPMAEFLQGGLGIHVGTRDRQLRPNGARGLAVTVDADGVHFEVYVPTVAAARLMPDLESNGQAAVVIGPPTQERPSHLNGLSRGPPAPPEPEPPGLATQMKR
jgi:hypothetical protein